MSLHKLLSGLVVAILFILTQPIGIRASNLNAQQVTQTQEPDTNSPETSNTPDYVEATTVFEVTEPPQRSTAFAGASAISYPHRDSYNRNSEMTIEAWVYRHNQTGCETIADHNQGLSYRFVTCPSIRFYRKNGAFAQSIGQVLSKRWTHVAASYNGISVTFFLNGNFSGASPLEAGPLLTGPLNLGGMATGSFVKGNLDEIRIWSTARSQSQIQTSMYDELRTGNGLEAVFGNGGRFENTQNVTGTAGLSVTTSLWGVLPRDLIVPRAITTPTLNGKVVTTFEYAGAEQMPLRYTNFGRIIIPTTNANQPDRSIYFVHTDTDLFIGLPQVGLIAPNWDQEESYLAVMLDISYTRGSRIQSTHLRLKIPLTRENASNATVQTGTDPGYWVTCAPPTICPSRGVDWDVRKDFDGDDVDPINLWTQSVEIRLAKSLLGEWTEVDGLAIGQIQDATPPVEIADRFSNVAPVGSHVNTPETWATVSYGEGSANLPRAILKGRLFNSLQPNGPAFANHKVIFGSIGTVTYERVTDAQGGFSFDVRVPPNVPMLLRPADCPSCKSGAPVVSRIGIQPLATGTTQYPGCNKSFCEYAQADLFYMQPPLTTTFTYPPPFLTARMLLNAKIGQATPEKIVVLEGANLHPLLSISLSPDGNRPDPNSWVLYPTKIVSISQDLTRMWVSLPALPKITQVLTPNNDLANTLKLHWGWVVQDNWGRKHWQDTTRIGRFEILAPPYPSIYGFGFENEGGTATYKEFLSVYGDNAYICVGLLGFCATHVIDPIYTALFFLPYKVIMGSTNGSCVGMSATSLLMQSGHISSSQFDPAIQFAAGFTKNEKPATYESNGTLGILTSPPYPTNLWGHIRRNQGVQLSTEVWGVALEQLVDQIGGGHMNQRLNQVRSNPDGYVLSLKDPNAVFGGHAVVAYAADPSDPNKIFVYDNNHPGNTNHYVDFITSNDTYYFSGLQWRGGTVFAFPISKWLNKRTFPHNIQDLIVNWVIGSDGNMTDVLYSTSTGEWGRRADGTFVETLPGAKALTLFNQEQGDTNATPLLLPMSGQAPTITVSANGGGYMFMSSKGGTILQIQASQTVSGDRDILALGYANNTLTQMNLKPQRSGVRYIPKIGMLTGEQERIVFRWANLNLPNNQDVGFRALHSLRGVEMVNSTSQSLTHSLILDSVEGASGSIGTWRFGSIAVPSGATVRATIADWPNSAQLKVEIDLGSNGTFEQSIVVTGTTCASDDSDLNGLPDACESTRIFLPMVTK